MPLWDIPKPYNDGEDYTEAMIDQMSEYIEGQMNSTKLDSTNIQAGGVEASNLASSSVTEAKIASSAVTTAKIDDDAVTTAKILDGNITYAKLAAAVQALLVPTGAISAYQGTSAPTGWLLCDGSAVSRTTYSALFTVIGESCGQGDNSTTFNVPDYRGRFLRGVDGDAGLDTDKGSRTAMATGGNTGNNVGSVQEDEVKQHSHTVPANSGATVFAQSLSGQNTSGTTADSSLYGGSETRPKNAYVNWIIKT
jgi:microcystin-dependent protein